MDRRDFLRIAGAGTGSLLTVGPAAADHEEEQYPQPVDGSEAYDPKITTLRYPLAGVPAIVEPADTIRLELDVDAPGDVSAHLEPSFGRADDRIDLEPAGPTRRGDSGIWSDEEARPRTYTVAPFEAPAPGRGVTPDLYDLHVTWDGGSDHQPRAVRLFREFPADPTVAVVADPQIGDPRALQAGAEEGRNKRSPEPLVTRTQRTVGDGSEDSRWNATQTALSEVNLLDPDLVLVAGDLTFGQDAPGKYYAEYEEAWRVFNQVEAPTFTVLGNHDGYIQGGVDGKALYTQTFAPAYYSVDVTEDLHLVALDTYDWNELDRLGGSLAVSTYGGQVRDAQWEWLRADLQPWVDGDRDAAVLAFGHHNPSWQWDGDQPQAENTEGVPVAEQVGRGTRFFTTDQAWTGQRHHFDIRALFDDAGVSGYFSGHSHRDRISRTVPSTGAFADIVETPGPHTPNDGQYHYVAYADRDEDGRPEGRVDNDDHSQSDLAEILHAGDGTLYVNCTTTGSSTGQYWGWRPCSLNTDTGDLTIDSERFGYPVTEEFLADRAVAPDAWNPDHSEVGLYSHPSYLLDVEVVEDTDTETTACVHNDLAVPVSGALVLSLGDCRAVRVSGGSREWVRRGENATDVKVAFEVPAEDSVTLSVACAGQAPPDRRS